jgi:hypothetical protein
LSNSNPIKPEGVTPSQLVNDAKLNQPVAKPPRHTIWRAVEMPTELGNGMKIGSLCGRRKIAKRHIVDHTAAQRAYRWCGISRGMVP